MRSPLSRSDQVSEPGLRVSWFELFYDLIVVASVSHGSHVFGEHPSWGMGTWLAASLVLLMTFWLLTMLSHNLYPGEDTPRRFLIFVQMIALIVASLSLGRGEEGLPDSVGFAALSVAFLSIALLYWRCSRRYPDGPRAARVLAPWTLLAAVVMAIGVALPSDDGAGTTLITWVFVIGMLCGILPMVFIVLNRRTSAEQINAEHLGERMGQLVLIVLGESFVSLVIGLSSQSRIPNPWYFLLDFVVVFSIWTLYFTCVVPAGVPSSAGRLRAWLGLHVIFIFGAIAAAGGFAALTLIPFSSEPTAKGFWTPLPLLYIMIGLLGLSILAGRPRAERVLETVTVVALIGLSATAIWVVPDQARWLTLVAAVLLIGNAAASAYAARARTLN